MEKRPIKQRSKIEKFPVKEDPVDYSDVWDEIVLSQLQDETDEYEKKLNADPGLDDVEDDPELFLKIVQKLKEQNKWQDGEDGGEEQETENDEFEMDNNVVCGMDGAQSRLTVSQGIHEGVEELEHVDDFGKMNCKEELCGEGLSEWNKNVKDSKQIETEDENKLTAEGIYDMLSEEDRKALAIGKRKLAHGKRSMVVKMLSKVAVVFLCVFVVSMTSTASRDYIMTIVNKVIGNSERTVISNSTDIMRNEEPDETIVLDAIEGDLNIKVPKLSYKPEGMKYYDYNIGLTSDSALIQYMYNDTILNISMYRASKDLAMGQIIHGNVVSNFKTNLGDEEVIVKEIHNSNGEKEFVTEFEMNGAYYTIGGILSKEDFTKLLNNIYF